MRVALPDPKNLTATALEAALDAGFEAQIESLLATAAKDPILQTTIRIAMSDFLTRKLMKL